MLRLIELINSLTDFELTQESVVLSEPAVSLNGTANTKVVIKPTLSSTLYFEREFSYNRLDLSLLRKKTISLPAGSYSYEQIIKELNKSSLFTYFLGFGEDVVSRQGYISVEDIVPGSITFTAGVDREFSIQASENSYFFIGSLAVVRTQ